MEHPENKSPKVLIGQIASGDQVVDDPTNVFFNSVRKAFPNIQAVEMEGVGAEMAIEQAQSLGKTVGFLMIRGISDMPRPPRSKSESRGTVERETWKDYASNTAAAFVVSYISNSLLI